MRANQLTDVLCQTLPRKLAADLVENFLAMRQDLATGTLSRSAPGKFVETVVQALQHLEGQEVQDSPNVDEYLRKVQTRKSMDNGLRVCMARIARAMYALRSKRGIIHKGSIDPSEYDLSLLHSSSQWVLAELVRQVGQISMDNASKLVEYIQVPIGGLVEDFEGRRLVLSDLTIKNELLVLLHSHYPERAGSKALLESMERRNPRSVHRSLRSLWESKLVDRCAKTGYKLTSRGFGVAVTLVRDLLNEPH